MSSDADLYALPEAVPLRTVAPFWRRLAFAAFLVAGLLALGFVAPQARAQSESVPQLLDTLRKVQREGKGNQSAARAWAELTARADVEQLPTILAALDGADPLAANWVRAAADAVAERQLQRGGKLPIAALEKFLHEKQHNPRARRLAFEWIARADATAPDRLIPAMLDDPALELRRDAVARVLTVAETALKDQKNDVALSAYQKALASARDLDQVKLVTEALAKLDHPVDLARHFGFIVDWKLVGPFPNSSGKGYDTVYPPESLVDLMASYEGSDGKVAWIAHHTDDEYGNVDLNKALGKHMGVAAYVAAEFTSDRARPADLRLGSQNAIKIWLNGKLLATAESYHANGVMDQYVGRGELKAGRNVILLKICQNEQTEEWAQDWKYQFRVCDELGTAILSTDRPGPRVAVKQAAAKPTKE